MVDNTVIDLKQFCSIDPYRPYLHQPFTRGKWTYATNGHICVRVPAHGTPDSDFKTPNAGQLFPRSCPQLQPIPRIPLEPPVMMACRECDGTGCEHDCPSCTCVCDVCNGTGWADEPGAIAVFGTAYARRYMRMIYALPGTLLGAPGATKGSPLFFQFAGGEGLLVPMMPGAAHNRREWNEVPASSEAE